MQQEQQTISVVFGIISYLRNFFNEDSFGSLEMNNMKLKTLKSTPKTSKLVSLINEIQLNQEAVYKVLIGIYSNKKIVEIYELKLSEKQDFKEICKSLQKMELLNGTYSMKIKLITNTKREIKGFKRGGEFWELQNKEEIKLSGMSIYVSGRCDSNNEINVRCNNTTSKNSAVNAIDCPCTVNTNEANMLQCKKCLKWNHAVCYGFFSLKDKRIPCNFECKRCTDELSVDTRNSSIYRRFLWIAFNEVEVFDEFNFEERLKISKNLTENLKSKMRKDGILRYNNGKPGKNEILKTTEVKDKIKEYFNGTAMECTISEEIHNY